MSFANLTLTAVPPYYATTSVHTMPLSRARMVNAAIQTAHRLVVVGIVRLGGAAVNGTPRPVTKIRSAGRNVCMGVEEPQ
jgi:hypothetical protein